MCYLYKRVQNSFSFFRNTMFSVMSCCWILYILLMLITISKHFSRCIINLPSRSLFAFKTKQLSYRIIE